MRHSVKLAGPFARAFLNAFGFAAIVSPWRTIYVLEEHLSLPLIAHERAHIAQIERDGACYFWPKILLDYFVKGYDASPYEIEARKIESRYH